MSAVATKVLHLIKGLGPGGAEQLLVNQARASDDQEFDFTVAYLVSWKDHLVPRIENAGWDTVCLESDRPWDLRWVWRFRRLVRHGEVDVVHGHSPLVSAFARLAMRTLPKRNRPRLVYTEHNEWGRHRPWTRRLNRWTIGFEDHVIAVSQGVRDTMSPDPDVEVVIHGIDIESVAAQAGHRDEVRGELGIADDEFVIGTVANLRKEKAYDVMLEAAALAVGRNPKLRFVSVGQGPLEAEIRDHHARLGLGDRFLLLGYREDAVRVMSAYDAFTLSSRHEGLPVSLMEAMALGLPVIATDVGGIKAAVVDWPAAIVDSGDVEQLARAYGDPPVGRSLGPAEQTDWSAQLAASYRPDDRPS